MKLILIGGWGYGNVGDDVILSSTVELLRQTFINPEISVVSYSEMLPNLGNVKYIKSLHAMMDFGEGVVMYNPIGKRNGFVGKIRSFLVRRIFKSYVFARFMAKIKKRKWSECLDNYDCVFLCGGGYFNEHWLSCVAATIEMVNLAKKNSKKFAVLGTGFGKINIKELRSDVGGMLSGSSGVWVRDEYSEEEVKKFNVDCHVIPDVALTKCNSKININREKEIIVIANASSSASHSKIAEMIGCAATNNNLRVKFVLTRLWHADFSACVGLSEELSNKFGVDSSIHIPADHVVLEDILSKGLIVISENLHGLITAYRNGLPIVAFNFYDADSPNGKKFRAFMNQIGRKNYVIGPDTSLDEGVKMIADSISQIELFEENFIFCQKTNMQAKKFISEKV